MEYWSIGQIKSLLMIRFQYSNTPLLHYSVSGSLLKALYLG
jgi:hypothetical protein